MKYRIKMVTRGNGEVLFYPQKRVKLFFWKPLRIFLHERGSYSTYIFSTERHRAERAIDGAISAERDQKKYEQDMKVVRTDTMRYPYYQKGL